MTQQFEDKLKEKVKSFDPTTELSERYVHGFEHGVEWAKEQLTQKTGKRYFLLFWKLKSKGSVITMTECDGYFNHEKECKYIYDNHKEDGILTNIIELSESDYNDFIK